MPSKNKLTAASLFNLNLPPDSSVFDFAYDRFPLVSPDTVKAITGDALALEIADAPRINDLAKALQYLIEQSTQDSSEFEKLYNLFKPIFQNGVPAIDNPLWDHIKSSPALENYDLFAWQARDALFELGNRFHQNQLQIITELRKCTTLRGYENALRHYHRQFIESPLIRPGTKVLSEDDFTKKRIVSEARVRLDNMVSTTIWCGINEDDLKYIQTFFSNESSKIDFQKAYLAYEFYQIEKRLNPILDPQNNIGTAHDVAFYYSKHLIGCDCYIRRSKQEELLLNRLETMKIGEDENMLQALRLAVANNSKKRTMKNKWWTKFRL